MGSLSEYRRTAGSVHSLGFHLVWCPKYRRSVLVGAVANRLRDLIAAKCAERKWTVEALEIMPDHVHLFVRSGPKASPAHVGHQIKGSTSHACDESSRACVRACRRYGRSRISWRRSAACQKRRSADTSPSSPRRRPPGSREARLRLPAGAHVRPGAPFGRVPARSSLAVQRGPGAPPDRVHAGAYQHPIRAAGWRTV